jgi:cytochrome bd-type quinol oxidase subunit 2
VDVVALVLLAVPVVGYAVVGGAGLGLGMLLPWLGRDTGERRQVVAVLRPLVRTGWAWLSVLVVASPAWAGVWPVLVMVAAGEAVRCAGVTRWPARRAFELVTAGSWGAALGWGWGLGSLIMAGSARPAGGMLVAFATVAVVLLMLAHGLAVGVRRLTGPPFQRARLLAGRGSRAVLPPLTTAVLAALPPAAGARLPAADRPAPAAGLAVLAALLVAAAWAVRRGRVGRGSRDEACRGDGGRVRRRWGRAGRW